jgi:arabinogalactan oligomer/maltooligosaccharide transport system permease protein
MKDPIMSLTTEPAPQQAPPEKSKAGGSVTASSLAIKLAIVGLIDALLIWMLVQAWDARWPAAIGFFIFALVAVNVVYFTRGLPMKYLLPGLLFLLVFQLYTMVLTGYSSFTNYGTGHLDTKESAISALLARGEQPIAESPEYPVVPIAKDNTVSMLLTYPDGTPNAGQSAIGTPDGITPVTAPQLQTDPSGKATGVEGYESLNLGSLSANPDLNDQWTNLRVPLGDTAGTFLKPSSATIGKEYKSNYVYDEAADTMTDTSTGVVYTPNEEGNFQSPDGEILQPGWRVTVGLQNYTSLVTDPSVRNRFLPISVWTFFFAGMTVLTTFALGLLLAIVMNDRRMRGQKYYRILLVLPYAMPIFLTAPLWRGMLNTDFGLINQMLPVDPINWLGEPNLARFSVLVVNLWIAYPYFFLVCTGALTAIPADLKEAAFVDGASGFHAFRTVVLPLLMISVAPLLIASFAFNFNNYTLIEMLTSGGPFPGQISDGGSTDLLINWTYRKAFNDTNQQLGLASAIALVIFIVVGTISAISFRSTKKLEEIGA